MALTGRAWVWVDHGGRAVRRSLAAVSLLTLTVGVAAAESELDPAPRVTWTMVDVTSETQQADAHVLETEDQVVLIDAGTYEEAKADLVPFLLDRDIRAIDIAFVSHVHKDHFGGLQALLEAGISVHAVEISLPDDEVCRREVPWGCSVEGTNTLLSVLADAGVPLHEPAAGDGWDLGHGNRLELVERLDRDTPTLSPIDVNDTSMILRLDVGDTSVLFTGDLNELLGRELATRDLGLRHHVLLKVPHHGAASLAPNEFFAAVAPEAAFVPAPTALWCSDRSSQAREWLRQHDTPTYVSGLSGDVRVTISDEIVVRTERPTAPCR